jgi:hypothetical protein
VTSRDLPCLPPELFEIHLGIQPEPLKLVPDVAPLPPSNSAASRRRGDTAVSWYEQQDLEVIRAGDNEIVEIQPEISMFGSLKIVDVSYLHMTCSCVSERTVLAAQEQTCYHSTRSRRSHGADLARPLAQPSHCSTSSSVCFAASDDLGNFSQRFDLATFLCSLPIQRRRTLHSLHGRPRPPRPIRSCAVKIHDTPSSTREA